MYIQRKSQTQTYTMIDTHTYLLTPSSNKHIARLPNNRLSLYFFTFNKYRKDIENEALLDVTVKKMQPVYVIKNRNSSQ